MSIWDKKLGVFVGFFFFGGGGGGGGAFENYRLDWSSSFFLFPTKKQLHPE